MLYGLLAVVLMAMDQRGHYVPQIRNAAGYLIEPVYHVVEWPVRALRNLFTQFQSRRSLRHENERLKELLLNREGALQRLDTLTEENRRLRSLFEGAQGQEMEYRFAELLRVDLDPFSHKVLIDLGSGDGVTPGQAVIDGAGVMGQVEDVHLHYSTVRLISDPNHALPVQINRTGLRTVAFGTGETGNLNLPSAPVLAELQGSPPPELATFWDENPNFVTAIEQLATTDTQNADGTTNYAVLGGRAGPFPEVRRIIVEAYSAVLDGGSTAQEALDEAAGRANDALSAYNEFFE